MKIFILDDDRESVAQVEEFITEYAKKMGVTMHARGFTDPETFLQEYDKSEEKPYLVILQVEMKKMSGIEVARNLRKKGSSVRLILMDVSDKYAM
ncbi:MAG: response regulator, partial [Blautia sp.]|nr:response regulator [Blautia sp.]